LESLQSWIELFRDNRGDKTVMVVCGNKSDLVKYFFLTKRARPEDVEHSAGEAQDEVLLDFRPFRQQHRQHVLRPH
jgi:GTPase SAR1 family protein